MLPSRYSSPVCLVKLILKRQVIDNWYVDTAKQLFNADLLKKGGKSWDVMDEQPDTGIHLLFSIIKT